MGLDLAGELDVPCDPQSPLGGATAVDTYCKINVQAEFLDVILYYKELAEAALEERVIT